MNISIAILSGFTTDEKKKDWLLKRNIVIKSFRCRHALCVQEFVQLFARRVVDLDEPAPFIWLLRPQEVERLLDRGLLLLGASVASVVGDDRDDS